jgi:hypothetical protein
MQPPLFEPRPGRPAPVEDPSDPYPEDWPPQLRAAGVGPAELARRQAAYLAERYADQRRRGACARRRSQRLRDGRRAVSPAPVPAGPDTAPTDDPGADPRGSGPAPAAGPEGATPDV